VSYLETDSIFFFIDCVPNVITLGKIQQGEKSFQFSIHNNHEKSLKISTIKTEGDLVNFTFGSTVPPRGSSLVQAVTVKKLPDGIFSFPILIYFEGYTTPIRLMLLGETPK
jgi:hypothetical protein